MSKLFIIEFEVDNGCQYYDDTALVKAESKSEAEEKLNNFINSKDSETVLTKIYSSEEYNGDIFTRRSGVIV